MKHLATLGVAILLHEVSALKAYQSYSLLGGSSLDSLNSVLGAIQQRLGQQSPLAKTDELLRQKPTLTKSIINEMGKYAVSWRHEIETEKEAAVKILKESYAEVIACKADFLSEMDSANVMQANLPNMSEAHRSCRAQQSRQHQKVLICEASLRGKTAVRKTECKNFKDNYDTLPQPKNFWSAVCEVQPPGQAPKEYFGHQLAFWDSLLKKHDEADKKCQNATSEELAKERECLELAAVRQNLTSECDAQQDRMDTDACTQMRGRVGACADYDRCYQHAVDSWLYLRKETCGPGGKEHNLKMQLHELLNLECVLEVMQKEPQEFWAAGSARCSDQNRNTTRPQRAGLSEISNRGHFNWSLPLAEALLTGVKGDKPAVDQVYTSISSTGDTDDEGRTAVEQHFEHEVRERKLGASLAEAFEAITPAAPVQDALQQRLRKDVAVVVYEQVWCSFARAVAASASVPSISFQPSYIDVFRMHAGVPPSCFQDDYDLGPEEMVYTLATCLRRAAPVPAGRRAVGAILPLKSRADALPNELMEWLASELPVVYCSLGSHMLSSTLAPGSLSQLVKGVLDAGCKLLMVLSESAQRTAMTDSTFAEYVEKPGSLRIETWVNQPKVLAHPGIQVFVSHCGANSVHECLAQGIPIVAMPFFDDQYYNAAALVQAGAGFRVQKRPITAGQVTAAVKAMLTSEAKAAAKILQKELLAEEGTEAAVQLVTALIQESQEVCS
ncbi:unnamed protein product [Effrenium voratum]|uniref:UDP-glycosyltransferases domain-containing protein n=1 Tax=Effrenium voratum TaxID=2562239 RepID=A0AA36HWW9_9DINO|nr:unnamed protein product [Effrenium voratum]